MPVRCRFFFFFFFFFFWRAAPPLSPYDMFAAADAFADAARHAEYASD